MKRKLQSTVHDYSAELGAGDWPSRPEITALRETKAILVGEPIRRESDRVPLPRYRNAVYVSKSTARGASHTNWGCGQVIGPVDLLQSGAPLKLPVKCYDMLSARQ